MGRMINRGDIFIVSLSGDDVPVEVTAIELRGERDSPNGHIKFKALDDDGTGELVKVGSAMHVGLAGEPVQTEVTSINVKGKLADLAGSFGLRAADDDDGQQTLPLDGN